MGVVRFFGGVVLVIAAYNLFYFNTGTGKQPSTVQTHQSSAQHVRQHAAAHHPKHTALQHHNSRESAPFAHKRSFREAEHGNINVRADGTTAAEKKAAKATAMRAKAASDKAKAAAAKQTAEAAEAKSAQEAEATRTASAAEAAHATAVAEEPASDEAASDKAAAAKQTAEAAATKSAQEAEATRAASAAEAAHAAAVAEAARAASTAEPTQAAVVPASGRDAQEQAPVFGETMGAPATAKREASPAGLQVAAAGGGGTAEGMPLQFSTGYLSGLSGQRRHLQSLFDPGLTPAQKAQSIKKGVTLLQASYQEMLRGEIEHNVGDMLRLALLLMADRQWKEAEVVARAAREIDPFDYKVRSEGAVSAVSADRRQGAARCTHCARCTRCTPTAHPLHTRCSPCDCKAGSYLGYALEGQRTDWRKPDFAPDAALDDAFFSQSYVADAHGLQDNFYAKQVTRRLLQRALPLGCRPLRVLVL
jgi:hypothetical protein